MAGEHPLGDAGQVILLCLFAAVWITDTFVLKFSTGLNACVALWPRILAGAVLLAVSLIVIRRLEAGV